MMISHWIPNHISLKGYQTWSHLLWTIMVIVDVVDVVEVYVVGVVDF